MEFYYDKKPNLIGPVMKTTVCKIIKQPQINNTISDKVMTYFSDIYNEYISNNKALVILILLFVGFLIYRYYNKTESFKKNQKENYENNENTDISKRNDNFLRELQEYQTKHLQIDNPPSMNPLISILDQNQNDIIHYPPEKLPIRIDNNIEFRRDISNQIFKPDALNSPTNYNPGEDRSYYNGTLNTYLNAQNTEIQNPFGWSNDFNTNIGNFVTPMTQMNMQNVADLQRIHDTEQQNLINSLQFGKHYDAGILDPPFAK